MAIELTWLGHGGWSIRHESTRILLDPFLTDSPVAPCQADEVDADVILVSHGHFDHIADVPVIAKRTGATVVAIFEIAQWLTSQFEIEETIGMNLGGAVSFPWGDVKMVPAWHSSQLPDGSYGGSPAGFVLALDGKTIYFACDTALFSDMEMIGNMGLDLAVVPIGDLFTMGPEDSVTATEMLTPAKVAPAHYNTWPPIEQDAEAWAALIREKTSAEPIVVEPGASFSL